MTLFKKYYKDANNDIKADEVFINSVIEKARKKRIPSQKSYYKYALTAAAAVVVLSATAVTMPLLTDNNNDGVISVVTPQTAQPEKDTVPNTPTQFPINTAVPTLLEKVKEEASKSVTEKETKSDKQKTEPIEKKEEKKNEQDFRADKNTPETRQEINNAAPKTGIETNGAVDFSASFTDSMEDTADSGSVTLDSDSTQIKEKAAADTMENNKHATGGGGGAKVSGGSAAAPSAPAILPPLGYYVTESCNGRYVFNSDDGAVITVTIEYTNDTDTEPVYDGLTVNFNAQKMNFTVTSDGADKSAIDELVNSLR